MERRATPLLARAAGELLEADGEHAVIAAALRLLGEHHGQIARTLLLRDGEELRVAAAEGPGADAVRTFRTAIGKGLVGSCAELRRVINVPDLTADARYSAGIPDTRGEICVPVVARDDLVGVLVLSSQRPRAFSADDEETLSAFAKLLGVAIVHARADAARQRDMQELQAISDVASRATALDLDGTLRSLADSFSRITTSDSVGVYLWDAASQKLVLAALTFDAHLYPSDYKDRMGPVELGEGMVGWVAKNRQPLMIEDVAREKHPRAVRGIPEGTKGAIVVPLVVEDQLLGVIRAVKMGTDPYTEDHFRLARTLGDQASLAIAAARAHRDQLERVQELAVLTDISSRLSEAATLHAVLGSALDGAIRLTGAEAGFIWRRDDDGRFRLSVSHNIDSEKLRALPPDDPRSLTNQMLRSGKPLLLADLQSHPGAVSRAAFPQMHACIGVPLLSESRMYGAMYVLHSRVGYFGERNVRQVQLVSAHGGAALARAHAFEEATRLAITDELTGFFNARYFRARLAEEIARAQRYGHELALVLVDSDALKNVNDSLGHEAGNEHLRQIARTIREQVRATDIVARYGGDEFVVLQPEAGLDAARSTAERIRSAASTALEGIATTVSAGVAAFPNVRDADALFREADRALAEAKRRGKNTVVVAD